MSTTNKVFLDSSFFTEGFKGNHLDFYGFFNTAPGLECYINAVVCSAHWYNLLGLLGSASPLTLKESNRIPPIVGKDLQRLAFFRDYTVLNMDMDVIKAAFAFMPKYNLLSNDALIPATCVSQQIPFIASHDSDFEAACIAENIHLVTPGNYQVLFPQM